MNTCFEYKGRKVEIRKCTDGTYSACVQDGDGWQLAQAGFRSVIAARKAGKYGAIVLNAHAEGKRTPSYLEVYWAELA